MGTAVGGGECHPTIWQTVSSTLSIVHYTPLHVLAPSHQHYHLVATCICVPCAVCRGNVQVANALLVPRVLALPTPLIVDCTVGCGGHTTALLTRHPGLRVIGFDKDKQVAVCVRRMARPRLLS